LSAQCACTECDTHIRANALCGAIAYTYAYAYTYADFNSNSHFHAKAYAYSEEHTTRQAAPDASAAPVGLMP
jgi:hypothetical protein